MSTVHRERESESGGTAYTFLKPMPTVRETPVEPGPASTPDDVAAALFPPRDSPSGAWRATGLSLGPYRIEEQIGRGGMGAVFRAADLRLDRVVSLKVLSPELSQDRSAVQRFQNEGRAAAKLDHDNIASVYDVGHDHGLYYIAFEFVAGINLRDELLRHGGSLPIEDAISYTLQILEALRHTAASDVVHRDIKPSNIILTPSGRAKLVDWGLARQNSLEMSQELTQTGTTLGTFDYISPEQAVDPRNVDVRSDIYSLGCTLFHMLTGEPPYPRGSMFQKVVDHHRAEAPDASARNPRVPHELSQIVQRMMASDPAQRYAAPEEVIHDLSLVAAEMGLQPRASAWLPLRDASHFPRAGWGWLGAFVALILLVWYLDRMPPRSDASPDRTALTQNGSRSIGAAATAGSTNGTGERTAPEEPGESSAAATDETRGLHQGLSEFQKGPLATSDVPQVSLANPDRTAIAKGAEEPTGSSVGSTLGGNNSTESPVAEPPSQKYVVRSAGGGEPKRYRTLQIACENATDNDIIELNFDGPSPELIETLRISGKRLTIRPAPNCRPVLSLGLAPDIARTGSQRTPRIISISGPGGAVELYDVDLVLRIPRGSITDRWSLFSLGSSGSAALRGVSVTIDNPERQPAAVFEIGSLMQPTMPRPSTVATAARPEIIFEEGIVRGTADFLWHESSETTKVKVAQSAFALTGSFYRRSAVKVVADAMAPRDFVNEVSLDHVTGVFRENLLRVELGDQGDTRPFEIDCRDSILVIAGANPPLVAMSGRGDVEKFTDLLRWNGTYCYFEVQSAFWQIRNESGQVTQSWQFPEWKRYWQSEREWLISAQLFENSGFWSQDDYASATPQDFALRVSASVRNPPVKGAGDGKSDAGVELTRSRLPMTLPRIDRDDAASRSSRSASR